MITQEDIDAMGGDVTYTSDEINKHIEDRAKHVGEDSKDVRVLRQLVGERDALVAARDMMGRKWADATAQRDAAREAALREVELRSAVKRAFAYASTARPKGYAAAIMKIEEILERALIDKGATND